jgi:hypothetical protein
MKCLRCKVEGIFDRNLCNSCVKKEIFSKVLSFKQDFFGSVPSPFIGHYNYPNVNVGVLSLQSINQNAKEFDDPVGWAKENKEIYEVLDFRSNLINARRIGNIKDPLNKNFSDSNNTIELVGMAHKPVEMEVNLSKKPSASIKFDKFVSPHGPNILAKKTRITENVKIHRQVDKVNCDYDLKSTNAISILYRKGFTEQQLTRILSVGSIGISKDRKLVPTRWSITTVDDNFSKINISKIRDFKEIDPSVYFGGYMGNFYLILTFPGPWSYELFELYVDKKHNPWSKHSFRFATDYEGHNGRKEYVRETAGGYYAALLPITEKLLNIKKSGSILVFRFITPEYSTPMGVWVVREATRKALKNNPLVFSSNNLLLRYAKIFSQKKFGVNLDEMIYRSKLLKEMTNQYKLSSFGF